MGHLVVRSASCIVKKIEIQTAVALIRCKQESGGIRTSVCHGVVRGFGNEGRLTMEILWVQNQAFWQRLTPHRRDLFPQMRQGLLVSVSVSYAMRDTVKKWRREVRYGTFCKDGLYARRQKASLYRKTGVEVSIR